MSSTETESVSDNESTCPSVPSADDESDDGLLCGAKPFLFEPEASADSSAESENDDPGSPDPTRLGNTTDVVSKTEK